MTPEEIELDVMTHLVITTAKANEIWPELDLPLYPIIYNLKGACAGQAWHKSGGYIRLNLQLLIDNPQEIAQLIPHELAHLIVHKLHKDQIFPCEKFRPSPHGWQWKMVMARLGYEATRCHKYDVAAYKTKRRTHKIKYKCDCGETFLVSPKVHEQCQNGWREYTCRICNRNLRWLPFKDLGLTY